VQEYITQQKSFAEFVQKVIFIKQSVCLQSKGAIIIETELTLIIGLDPLLRFLENYRGY